MYLNENYTNPNKLNLRKGTNLVLVVSFKTYDGHLFTVLSEGFGVSASIVKALRIDLTLKKKILIHFLILFQFHIVSSFKENFLFQNVSNFHVSR